MKKHLKKLKRATKSLIKTMIETNRTEAQINIKITDKEKSLIHKEEPIIDKINFRGQEVRVTKKTGVRGVSKRIDKILRTEKLSTNPEDIKIKIDQKEHGKIEMANKVEKGVTIETTLAIRIDNMV